jgi:hypothetical protein
MYVAIKNFKDGNKKDGWKHYKAGQPYDGPHAEQFLKSGMIEDAGVAAERKAMSIEEEMASLKKRYDELKAIVKAERAKKAGKPSDQKGPEQDPENQDEANQGEGSEKGE